MCGFHSVSFDRIPELWQKLCHRLRCVKNYFISHKLSVVSIVCLICLNLREMPCVMGVAIGTGSFLKAMCFGSTVNTDGILYAICESYQGAITYCNNLLRT